MMTMAGQTICWNDGKVCLRNGVQVKVVPVLPVGLPHPLHQRQEGYVLPEREVSSRILARVERYRLPLTDLEDCPDHPDVPALLPPLPLLGVVILPFHGRTADGTPKGIR